MDPDNENKNTSDEEDAQAAPPSDDKEDENPRDDDNQEDKEPEDPTVSLRSDLDSLAAVVNKINTRLESMEKALNDRLDGPNPPAEEDRSNESGSERDVDDLFDPAVQNDDF